jgi:hypothetical protein
MQTPGDRASDEKRAERPPLEGEILPPGSADGGFSRGVPSGIFFDLRGADGSIRMKPISRWKIALWLTVIAAIGFALVLTFASLFVVAAAVAACAAALAIAVTWVKGLFRSRA